MASALLSSAGGRAGRWRLAAGGRYLPTLSSTSASVSTMATRPQICTSPVTAATNVSSLPARKSLAVCRSLSSTSALGCVSSPLTGSTPEAPQTRLTAGPSGSTLMTIVPCESPCRSGTHSGSWPSSTGTAKAAVLSVSSVFIAQVAGVLEQLVGRREVVRHPVGELRELLREEPEVVEAPDGDGLPLAVEHLVEVRRGGEGEPDGGAGPAGCAGPSGLVAPRRRADRADAAAEPDGRARPVGDGEPHREAGVGDERPHLRVVAHHVLEVGQDGEQVEARANVLEAHVAPPGWVMAMSPSERAWLAT